MDFFYRPDRKIFTITDEMLEVIRNLKCQPQKDGYWYKNQPRWIADNIPSNISFSDIGIAMQFIASTADIKGDHIPEHFRMLLRRSYIDHYMPENSTDGSEVIALGGKRPFGNSHVEGDVREVLIDSGFYGNKTYDDFDGNSDYAVEEEELQKFIDFLINDFFKNFEMRYYSFRFKDKYNQDIASVNRGQIDFEYWESRLDYIHSMLYNWEIDISEIRDRKIKEVLND